MKQSHIVIAALSSMITIATVAPCKADGITKREPEMRLPAKSCQLTHGGRTGDYCHHVVVTADMTAVNIHFDNADESEGMSFVVRNEDYYPAIRSGLVRAFAMVVRSQGEKAVLGKVDDGTCVITSNLIACSATVSDVGYLSVQADAPNSLSR